MTEPPVGSYFAVRLPNGILTIKEAAEGEQPFLPLLYLGPEALTALYPHTLQMIANDMEGGEVLAQLQNFSNSVRAYLQHYGVFVDG